jgi:hypothetical protein
MKGEGGTGNYELLRSAWVSGCLLLAAGFLRRLERDPIPNDTTPPSPRRHVIVAGKEMTLVTLKCEGAMREYL